MADDFRESAHPRDSRGQFAAGGDGGKDRARIKPGDDWRSALPGLGQWADKKNAERSSAAKTVADAKGRQVQADEDEFLKKPEKKELAEHRAKIETIEKKTVDEKRAMTPEEEKTWDASKAAIKDILGRIKDRKAADKDEAGALAALGSKEGHPIYDEKEGWNDMYGFPDENPAITNKAW